MQHYQSAQEGPRRGREKAIKGEVETGKREAAKCLEEQKRARQNREHELGTLSDAGKSHKDHKRKRERERETEPEM